MSLRLGLTVGIALLVSLTGALAYGIYSGCGFCGPALAGVWGVAILLVLPIGWGLSRPSRVIQTCIKNRSDCAHNFVHEEYEEVVAWHADTPIWSTVRVKRCCKCDYEEEKDIQASW